MNELPTAPATTAPPIAAGEDRYELRRQLGVGGMGVVWEAHDRVLDRRVALKLLHDQFLGAEAQARLADEARAMARLSHKNVVAVHDVGEREGRAFVTMELIDGEPVSAWLTTPRPWREVVAVFAAAGAGLAAAHAAGVLHRDIKPSNLLRGVDGEVRVADFGVARASEVPAGAASSTTTAGCAGTPAYMAPERLRGEPCDARSDQFSFAVALYEALHGRRPFIAAGVDELAAAIAAGPPAPRRPVPRWLHAVTARGLAADPAARFPSMDALVAALRGPRRRVAAIAVGAVAVATIGGVALARSAGPPRVVTPPPPPTADLTSVHAVTALGGCAYAPAFADDATLVFDETRGDAVDVLAVPVDGGGPVTVADGPGWQWRATAGRRPGEIAYLDHGDDGSLAVAFYDVTRRRAVERLTLSAMSIAVRGDALYYVDGSQRQVRRRVGARDELVAPTEAATAQLAVSSRDAIAVIGAPSNSGPRLCVAGPGDAALTCGTTRVREGRPAFSADGAYLYFPATRGLVRRTLATGEDALLVPNADGVGGVAVSPRGDRLAWSDCRRRGRMVDLATTPPTVVRDDPDARGPVAGPHGLLAWLEDGDPIRLMVRTADGTVAELFDGRDGTPNAPSFSSDGARVAFALAGDHGGIRVIDVDGGLLAPLTADASDTNPMWLGDGRIAFTRYDAQQAPYLYAVAEDGGEVTLIRAGRVTLGVDVARGRVLLGGPRARGLYWWDPRTDRETPGPATTGAVMQAAVSPDGRWLVVEESSEHSTFRWRQRLDVAAAPEPLPRPTAGDDPSSMTIDDDGRVLTMLRSWRGELHVARLR